MKKLIVFFLSALTITYAQDSLKTVQADSINAPGANVIADVNLNFPLASAPVLVNDKIFFAGKDGSLACCDTTARIIWNNNLNVQITSRPIIKDSTIALGDSNGDIFSLNEKTGNQTQSIGLDRAISSDLITFEYKGDIALAMPKSTSSKSVIVFATQEGHLHCYDLETLQEYWTNKDAKDTVSGTPLYIDNKILFNSADGFLYCIDAGNGLLIWRWKESAESSFYKSNIVTDGKSVFVVSNNNDVFAIDLLLGKLTWKSKNIKVLPALALSRDKKILYAFTFDKRVLFFSAAEGAVVRAVKLEQPLDEKPIPVLEREGKLFFARSNELVAINKKYKEEPVLSFSSSPINYLTQITDTKFLVSDTNGRFIIFTLRDN